MNRFHHPRRGHSRAHPLHALHPLALGAAALLTPLVYAQGSTDAGAAPVAVERVIVSAQKRDEVLQDVPLAVSEISGRKLDALQIDRIEQLRLVVPSFDAGAFGTTVRGVGTSTFSVSIEQSVSTVIDDIVLGRPEMSLGSFYDLARVEVLRGPQGMLFGKNASAGLVSITTQQPKLGRFEALANLSAGNGGQVDSNATLNMPLGERAALRVGGYVNRFDGLITNRNDGRRFNGNDERGARLRLAWNPRGDVQVKFGLDGSRQDSGGMWTAYKANPAGAIQARLAACGLGAGPDLRETCVDGPVYKRVDNEGAHLRVDWSVAGYTLSSISGVRRNKSVEDRDSDSTPVNVLNRNFASITTRNTSQELRLASPDEGRVRWQAGLFWYELDIVQRTDQVGSLGVAPAPIFNSTVDSDIRSVSTAIFGQADIEITRQLTAIVGARHTRDEVGMEFQQFAQPGFTPFLPVVRRSDRTQAESTSWRLGAKYQIEPAHMVYATVSRGYKGPGFNQTAVANATVDQSVAPEVPTNIELGLRSSFLRGALVTNLTLFDQTFEDYQAQVLDTSIFPAVVRTVNAGRLKTRGLEADIQAVLPNHVVLTAALAYLDSEYQDFGLIACWPGQTAAQGCTTLAPGANFFDPSGRRLANAARVRATLTAYHQRALSDRINGFVQADASWRSEVNTTATGDPNAVIPAYGLVNASFGLAAHDERWRLTLWVRNLADKRYVAGVFGTPFGSRAGGDYSQVPSLDARRRYGLSLGLRF